MALVAWPAGRAAAAVNISGSWNLTLQHPDLFEGPITCSAMIGQGGTSLTVSITCDQLASGTLTGTIDVDMGNFTLSGNIPNPMTFVGQAAQDGNSMSGFWVMSPGPPGSGTFSGTRTAGVGGVTELVPVSAAASNNVGVSSGDEAPVLAYTLIGVGLLAAFGALAAVRRRLA